MKGIYLYINTNYGDILLPFKNLKSLDSFTVNFEDPMALVEVLFDVLDIRVNSEDVLGVSVLSKYKVPKQEALKTKVLPVKYLGDNYEDDSVKEEFIKYLQQDHKRILHSDIRFVTSRGMVGFLGGSGIGDKDIEHAVDSYFANDSYKKTRDTYFLINKSMHVRKKKRKVREEEMHDDNYDYIENLLQLSLRSDEDREMAMDELAKFSMSELSRVFRDNDVHMFEGVSNYGAYTRMLESDTGMSLGKLRVLANQNILVKGKKK